MTHNSVTPEHITVIGHSYGATTVADAFAHSGMHANDAVLLGCPGTDLAHSAADFHLDGGHVYVGSASTDPISWIGESTGMPAEWLKGNLREHWVPLPWMPAWDVIRPETVTDRSASMPRFLTLGLSTNTTTRTTT